MSKSICWKVVSSNCTKSLPAEALKLNCPQTPYQPSVASKKTSNSEAFFFFASWTCTRHVYLILQSIMPRWSLKRASSVHFWSGPSKILTFAKPAGGTVDVSKCSKSLSACFTKNLTIDRTELAWLWTPNWWLNNIFGFIQFHAPSWMMARCAFLMSSMAAEKKASDTVHLNWWTHAK